jgi:5-methylthioadenosine/S-adenosylhomocysteine deaminase
MITLPLLERDSHVAMGTDGHSANLIEGMKTLTRIQRNWTGDFRRWPGAVDILRVATMGGAYAFGEEDRLGSIEAGKQADLTLLDRDSIAYVPFHRPVNQIVYADKARWHDTPASDAPSHGQKRVVAQHARSLAVTRDAPLLRWPQPEV